MTINEVIQSIIDDNYYSIITIESISLTVRLTLIFPYTLERTVGSFLCLLLISFLYISYKVTVITVTVRLLIQCMSVSSVLTSSLAVPIIHTRLYTVHTLCEKCCESGEAALF